MSTSIIRMARIEDAAQINGIYEHYILDTAVTFEYEPVALKDFEYRMESVLARLPYLVCEAGDEIAGYAYLAPFKERAAFAWDLEITVYLKETYFRHNIGTALYQALFEIAEHLGYVNVYALITDPNDKSKKLHESLGFHQVGLYPETGYKFGRWWGLNVMCKKIGSTNDKPSPTRELSSLPQDQLQEIFRNAQKRIRS